MFVNSIITFLCLHIGLFVLNMFHLVLVCDEESVGNGKCNDIFNVPGCDFDGGDCCLPLIDDSQCWNCDCHNEDTYKTDKPWWQTTTQPPIDCALKFYFSLEFDDIGDGFCNDYLNHKACNFDGGDCCFGIKGVECSKCECKNENTGFPILTTTAITLKPLKTCQFDEPSIGNGICNSLAYNFECDYDDGDCEGK